MGGGKAKPHESFSVAPSAAGLSGVALADPPNGVGAAQYEIWSEAPGEEPDLLDGPFDSAEEAEAVLGSFHQASVVEITVPDVDDAPEVVATAAADEAIELEAPASAELLEADVVEPAQTAPTPASWGEILTPVPTEPAPGDICGTPLLVGGADLDDALATLVSYKDAKGSREVLMATVTAEAESKLLEALALSEEKLVPVVVEKELTGRLPLDTQHQLHEQLAKVAKSVNHHLHAGDEIPEHTHQNFEAVMSKLGTLSSEAQGDDDKAMVGYYTAAGEAIAARLTPGYSVAYDEGGKVAKVEPYETTGMVSVTEYIPAPAEDVPEGLRSAQVRVASRIAAQVNPDGSTSWDGAARSKAAGQEYVIDLGDGYTAVYRPYAGVGSKSPDFSHRGALELVAPQGAGHGPELVSRLGQLNLVNRPMTAAEGEWAYLTRNVEAQGLAKKAAVATALAEADGLEDATTELLVAERAHEAIGMDDGQLRRFAKQLRLEAEAKALPAKVAVVREAVATTMGLANGAALAASPGYEPTPRVSGGWLVWDRFDVVADPKAVKSAFGGRGLWHHVSNNNLEEILRNGGVLACTERRRVMGISSGKGMSEGADMGTGGAKSVFLRVHTTPTKGPELFWDDPSVLLRRSDWYGYNSDHFGSINAESGHSTSGMTHDPAKVAGFSGGSNEVMFKHGIDLLGEEAPSMIRCSSAAQRKSILELLAARGITHLRSKPVAEVVL